MSNIDFTLTIACKLLNYLLFFRCKMNDPSFIFYFMNDYSFIILKGKIIMNE